MSDQEDIDTVVEKCKTKIFSASAIRNPRIYDPHHDEELNEFSSIEFDSYEEWLNVVGELAEDHLNVPTNPDGLKYWNVVGCGRSKVSDRKTMEEYIKFADLPDESDPDSDNLPQIRLHNDGKAITYTIEDNEYRAILHESLEDALNFLETGI